MNRDGCELRREVFGGRQTPPCSTARISPVMWTYHHTIITYGCYFRLSQMCCMGSGWFGWRRAHYTISFINSIRCAGHCALTCRQRDLRELHCQRRSFVVTSSECQGHGQSSRDWHYLARAQQRPDCRHCRQRQQSNAQTWHQAELFRCARLRFWFRLGSHHSMQLRPCYRKSF